MVDHATKRTYGWYPDMRFIYNKIGDLRHAAKVGAQRPKILCFVVFVRTRNVRTDYERLEHSSILTTFRVLCPVIPERSSHKWLHV
jgi:hypothetical protein